MSSGIIKKPEWRVSRILFNPLRDGQTFIWAVAHVTARAAYPNAAAGPAGGAFLFGLAPCGVYQASDVTTESGGLLLHRFTLACA